MGVDHKPPPKEVISRQIVVQTNSLNTIEVPHDPHDLTVERWFDSTSLRKPTAGNLVDAFIDGGETFAKMAEAIESAVDSTHYVYMLNWFIDLDLDLIPSRSPSAKLGDLLVTADQREVQVRGMFWDQIFRQNTDAVNKINNLKHGAAILDNNTLNSTFPKSIAAKLVAILGPGGFILSPAFNPSGSHHQKILLVKGKEGLIGFCGGVDFNTDRVSTLSRRGDPLHDVHCRIEGPAAGDLLRIFVDRWTDHGDARVLDGKKGILLGLSEPQPPPRGSAHVQIGCTFGNGKKHAGVKNRFGGNFYSFAPDGERTAFELISHAVKQAKRFIYIEDQYLVSLELGVILQKQLSLVEFLVVLIPHSFISDHPHVWKMRKRVIDELKKDPATKDKVVICSLTNFPGLPFKAVDTVQNRNIHRHTYVHSKIIIIDDQFAIIGSANSGRRSYTHDSEVVAGIADPSRAGGEDRSPTVHLAHQLRVRLWAEHLNMTEKAVFDPSAIIHWKSPPLTSRIRSYDENEDTDSLIGVNLLVTEVKAEPDGS